MMAPVRAAPFPVATAISDGVGHALENAILRHGATQSALRSAVEACVVSLRAQGMTPEGVVITVKALVLHEANGTGAAGREHRLRAADYLMSDVVGWCADKYFRDDPGTG